jgi:hypothetical protein
MTSTIATLVDAIAADLAGLTLPAHSVWLYADPPVIRSDVGRILGIFPKTTEYALLSTNSNYQDSDDITIAWYEPLVASSETGGAGDPAVAKAALAFALTIEARLRTYGVGIPGFADENDATLVNARYGIVVGTTTWAAMYVLRVARWA